MKKWLAILLIFSGFSCNPYRQYYFTHYHINATYDPASTILSANVKMVFVPTKAYHDSITFLLNEHVEIQSLSAQDLKYYEFEDGRLVLYIGEAVMPGDQLHVSMNYRGMIGAGPGQDPGKVSEKSQERLQLTPETFWYPFHPGIDKLTYAIEMDLPGHYHLGEPGMKVRHRWHWSTEKPAEFIVMPRVTESITGHDCLSDFSFIKNTSACKVPEH